MNLLKLALVSTIFLSGCSANHYAIYWANDLSPDRSTVMAVDAKQRFLLSNVITKTTKEIPATPATPAIEGKAATESKPAIPGTPATIEHIRRFCAEPGPDVFSVLGQAASGGGSFGQTADPKSMNIALQAAISSSETGATISRTQTINMLKEMMYRTCERYLNGQISDDASPIIAARDQRVMTSILAIEQLTGTVLPKPVVIAATGSASTGQSTNDAILSLDNANKEVDKKKSVLEAAQKEFDAIDKPAGTCETLKAKKAGDLTTDEQTTLAQCNAKQNKLEVAKQELKDAQGHYNRLANLADKPGVSSTSTSAQLLTPTSSATEIDLNIEKDRTQRITAVANVVKEIVSHSFNQDDETAFFCYSVINKGDKPKVVTDACLTFIIEKMRAQTEIAALEAAQFNTARLKLETVETSQQMGELRRTSFEQFWDKIKKDSSQVDTLKLTAIIDNILTKKPSKPLQDKLDAMKKKTTKDEISKIFNTLPLWVNDELLKD